MATKNWDKVLLRNKPESGQLQWLTNIPTAVENCWKKIWVDRPWQGMRVGGREPSHGKKVMENPSNGKK